ncbi:ATP-binding protein, partial [Thioclava sp.]|uniref:ATP-binding protein n=1 Tax=Thioclava sp. TaxID=1933450 RepID=UPI003241ED2F
MERSKVLDAMGQLKLYGMRAAYDEIIATAVKRQHEPQQIVGDLLHAEINEKQARSIKYQMTIAKLPLAKEVDEFSFEETPVNETLVAQAQGVVDGDKNLYDEARANFTRDVKNSYLCRGMK